MNTTTPRNPVRRAAPALLLCATLALHVPVAAAERNAYFGDLHVHTKYSADAYGFGARNGPDEAYAFARGAPLRHPSGQVIRMRSAPLDFLAVTDHAEYLGNVTALGDPDHRLSGSAMTEIDDGVMMTAFLTFGAALRTGERDPELYDEDGRRDTWQRIVAAAERHNAPGAFTTFIGYEYSSAPDGMLHRNVIFAGSRVPELPFGATDSLDPEDLWAWLDGLRAEGIEALAIPHNSNLSNGNFFGTTTFGGEPFDARYAEARLRNEPIVEITQVKGTSETHPLLSPNDEWAGFEVIGDGVPGAYVREALLTGLEQRDSHGVNPYRFGFIGSSDTHNVGGAYEEPTYHGKIGNADGRPEWRRITPVEERDQEGDDAASLLDQLRAGATAGWGASGLAGVWAEANTREAIYAALRRKETFGTSGPRIRVQFFAGYGPDADADADGLRAGGVPMGGELRARRDAAPTFLAWAMRDPNSAWLQRVQIVKGWLDDGGARRERVFDVACSDGLSPDPATHRCPDNGAGVDLDTCAFDHDRGAVELRAVWSDPEFDGSHRAFYYARVLENPTCRWSTWDALNTGLPLQGELPATVQERAWSSPIWMTPAG